MIVLSASAMPFRCRADARAHFRSTNWQACSYHVTSPGVARMNWGRPSETEKGSPRWCAVRSSARKDSASFFVAKVRLCAL